MAYLKMHAEWDAVIIAIFLGLVAIRVVRITRQEVARNRKKSKEAEELAKLAAKYECSMSEDEINRLTRSRWD